MKLLGAVTIAILLASLGGFLWWSAQLSPISPSQEKQQVFVITKGQPASLITQNLLSQGLIRSALAAKLYLIVSGLDQKILPGAYLLSPSQDLKSVFTTLTLGPQDIWVTFPEGWRREQFAARLDAVLTAPDKTFSPADFIVQTATLEGRLFPDTYLIPTSATAADIIHILTTNFTQKVGTVDSTVLTLASLVERESAGDDQRSLIAGILLKRLKAGWPLQVDATVQYAVDTSKCKITVTTCKWWEPVTDTRFPSPYNTYLKPGLPPTPIANPGLAALTAAQSPQNSPYWYYLHDATGLIHYATSIEQHNSNIDKYLRR